MNIGVSTGCFFPRQTDNALEAVALTGAKYTEIFFNTDSELDEEYVYKLKNIADANGIQVISVHPFTSAIETFMFWSKSDYKMADSIRYYEKYFRACVLSSSLTNERRQAIISKILNSGDFVCLKQ